MRKIKLDFDSISSSKPYHYTDKTLYVANGEMELDYTNSTTSGSGENWGLDTVRIYIPAPDGRAGCAELNPNATSASQHKFRVYHYDHLGSIQCITNWGTATLATNTDSTKKSLYSYEAWGQRRDPVDWIGSASSQSTYTSGGDTDATPRGFTAHEMLDDLGLVHMNGRIYDPQIGRFLSADPVIQAPNNLQSYNRYSYCMNNPLTYTDPTGYSMEAEFWGKTDSYRDYRFKDQLMKWFGYSLEQANQKVREKTEVQRQADKGTLIGTTASGLAITAPIAFEGVGTALFGAEAIGGTVGAFTLGADGTAVLSQTSVTTSAAELIKSLGLALAATSASDNLDSNSVKPQGDKGQVRDTSKLKNTDQDNIPQKARDTLKQVQETGKSPEGYKGGRKFKNKEGNLPENGNYKEYDVDPKPLEGSRNSERIVIDEETGKAWYTSDHYKTFKEIK